MRPVWRRPVVRHALLEHRGRVRLVVSLGWDDGAASLPVDPRVRGAAGAAAAGPAGAASPGPNCLAGSGAG
eukprot:4645999-Alexandrium_andersonii.AAC.1